MLGKREKIFQPTQLFFQHIFGLFFPPLISEKVIFLLNLHLTQCAFPSLLLGGTTSSLVRVYVEAFKKFEKGHVKFQPQNVSSLYFISPCPFLPLVWIRI